MGADLSRVRFDARRDHAGVVMQQGRLLLDADWNELVAITDRRMRADAVDLGSAGPKPGIAGVAVVPRTTPDAFKLTAASGDLTIGRGRMYVDGLLAENHGTGAAVFDALLDDSVGSADTLYSKQPYWPTPTPLPTAGTHLVYLDVWTREVTPLEAPDLVEAAVGADTTARAQTVWQVRVHAPDTPGISCTTPDKDIPGWAAVLAPSAGRLTTDTVPVTDDDDPCALPPTGGYRGLENQTYRVEIHDGGAPGTATFKWSRDNASVASAVVEVRSSTVILPASLGKDGVLRFDTGDWAEITDDNREFNQVPGELRKVEVHDEDGTLSFTPALPADLVMTPAQAMARHLRVRRWDQHGQVKSAAGANLDNLDAPAAKGTIVVPSSGTAVVLESGVTVALATPGGGVFRTGDHWIFVARTADTSVEKLTAAPPRGVHHHYARLGVLSAPASVSDCRTLWPADCECDGEGVGCSECTACVTPESHASGALTIQAAVALVTPTGGTVCLAVGTYHLDAPVTIANAASVTVRGQGPKTLLIARAAAFQVTMSLAITLQDMGIVGATQSLVLATNTGELTVQRLAILAVAAADAPVAGVELAGVALLPRVRENTMITPIGVHGGGNGDNAPLLVTSGLEIDDNLLLCGGSGVRFEGRVAHVGRNAITGNGVANTTFAGVHALGVLAPSASCVVSGNYVATKAAGIEVGGSGFTVADNEVHGQEGAEGGIAVQPSLFAALRGLTRITGNNVRDFGGTGISVAADVADLAVAHNSVERAADGIVVARARLGVADVSNNVVRDTGTQESDSGPAIGIAVVGAERALIESNTVIGVGSARTARDGSIGIVALACAQVRVAGNAVDRVGFDESPGQAIGIGVAGLRGPVEVHGNTSRRADVDVDQDARSEWIGLLVGTGTVGASHNTLAAYHSVASDNVNYLVGPSLAFAADLRSVVATVSDNIATGGGEAPAVRVALNGNAVVATNQAQQMRESRFAALEITAEAGTVATNVAVGGRPSVDIRIDPKRVAVVGNLASSDIVVNGASLSAPWDALNPIGVV